MRKELEQIKTTIALAHSMVLGGEKTDGTLTKMVEKSIQYLEEINCCLENMEEVVNIYLSENNGGPDDDFDDWGYPDIDSSLMTNMDCENRPATEYAIKKTGKGRIVEEAYTCMGALMPDHFAVHSTVAGDYSDFWRAYEEYKENQAVAKKTIKYAEGA